MVKVAARKALAGMVMGHPFALWRCGGRDGLRGVRNESTALAVDDLEIFDLDFCRFDHYLGNRLGAIFVHRVVFVLQRFDGLEQVVAQVFVFVLNGLSPCQSSQ